MFFEGFKFGMILQISIGPVFLFILKTAINKSLLEALTGVLAVSIIDAFFIITAFMGLSFVINKKINRIILICLGVLILMLFGINSLLSGLNLDYVPKINFGIKLKNVNTFTQGILLTLSNPLTVVFWSGLLTAKLSEEKYDKKKLILFLTGCVFSTIFFLSIASIIGKIIGFYIPEFMMKITNILVGIILIGFSLKYLKNIKNKNEEN